MKSIKICVLALGFSVSVFAAEPQQLNYEGFSYCFSKQLPKIDLISAIINNVLYPGDLLLPYLALYAGKRIPVVSSVAQFRWSTHYGAAEQMLAENLWDHAQEAPGKKLTPDVIYGIALSACGRPDAFCASLITHNVLRTLGRSETAYHKSPITGQVSDYNPAWFRNNRNAWLERAKKIQQSMISLYRNGRGDKWGENYHFFGLLNFSIHEMALYRNVTSAWLVARMNQVLNPILAGGAEDPIKAKIDRDSIEVASYYFRGNGATRSFDCTSEQSYRLP